MRYRSLAGLLAAVVGGVCLAGMDPQPADDPVKKGLEVHEWGVFRVHDDVEMANADMRGEWGSLPKFFYGQTAGRALPSNPERQYELVTKPVVFFHAPEPLNFELRINFPG